MSRFDESYEDRREREREERRDYEGDVFYDVWRSGGNVDRINSDRVEDHYYQGMESQQAARIELRSQQPRNDEPDIDESDYERPEEEGDEL
jgi:hypothetical protein